jgi:hypothetical protein
MLKEGMAIMAKKSIAKGGRQELVQENDGIQRIQPFGYHHILSPGAVIGYLKNVL